MKSVKQNDCKYIVAGILCLPACVWMHVHIMCTCMLFLYPYVYVYVCVCLYVNVLRAILQGKWRHFRTNLEQFFRITFDQNLQANFCSVIYRCRMHNYIISA